MNDNEFEIYKAKHTWAHMDFLQFERHKGEQQKSIFRLIKTKGLLKYYEEHKGDIVNYICVKELHLYDCSLCKRSFDSRKDNYQKGHRSPNGQFIYCDDCDKELKAEKDLVDE